MSLVDEHIQALLKLSVQDRALAARRLLESLDGDGDGDDHDDDGDGDGAAAAALRTAELARRGQAVADGTAELIDADEVRRRVSQRLRDVRG